VAEIIAPISKFQKQNKYIIIAVLLGAAAWFAYDGYFNEKFKEDHTIDGKPDQTLVFNQKSPPFFLAGAILAAGCLFAIKGRRLVADEDGLSINGKNKIPYKNIQSINKTYFDDKGYFILTYNDDNGNTSNIKFKDRNYDNLPAILDKLVAKIS
jgi:hypothetical protein